LSKITAKNLHILNEKYWKRQSIVWPVLQIIIFVIALLVNIILPTKQEVNLTPYRVVLAAVILFFTGSYLLSFQNRKIKIINNHMSQFYFAFGFIFIVWDLLSTKSNILPLPFFPSLAQILQVFAEDYGTLIISTAYSLRLLFFGFAVGTIIGLVTGVLMGWYKQCGYWIFPIIKVMSVIPAVAWIPIAMYILPSSLYAEIFLIVLAVWFPVAYMTSTGIVNIQKSYFEAAKTLGANETFLIFKVAIPGAMPSIFTGIYTATGISFATLVVSEIIGAVAGLGWYINWAKSWADYSKVYASIIVMAIVFSIIMSIIFKVRDRVLIWQKGLLK
jgi:NitT/TauT family transport system permease protein